MRAKILFLLLLPTLAGAQQTYYWSSTGSDANPGTEDLPKQSISLLETYMDTAAAGTTFKLEAGSVWDEGEMYISNGNQLYVEKYGTGDNPVISGEKTLVVNSLGANLYRAIDSDLLQRDGNNALLCPWVLNDGVRAVYSDAQDSGVYYNATYGSTEYISDNTQNWTTNEWVGAQIWLGRVGTGAYVLYTATVTSNTDTALYFSAGAMPWSDPDKGYKTNFLSLVGRTV